MAAFLAVTGERQDTLCQAVRILHTTGQEVHLAQVAHHTVPSSAGALPYLDLVEQAQRLGDPPGQGIGQTQSCRNRRQIERDVRSATLSEGVFEHGDGLREVPFVEGKQAKSVLRHDCAGEVTSRFGNLDRFLAIGNTLDKRPQFCTALQ